MLILSTVKICKIVLISSLRAIKNLFNRTKLDYCREKGFISRGEVVIEKDGSRVGE